MATISASDQAQLLTALSQAQSGDTIALAAGNYGTLSLDGTKYATRYLKYAGEVTITSADANNQAVIDGITLNGVTNMTFKDVVFDYKSATTSGGVPVNVNVSKFITFDGVTFDGEVQGGYGRGTGIKVSQGNDVVITDSIISDYRKGIEAWATTGLTIENNTIQNISYDGVVTGHVVNHTISGNTIAMNANPAEDQHRDGIQIWNQGTKAATSNLLIEGNTITATDTTTHGIFMGNADAKTATDYAEFYSNVTIQDNVIMTGQKLGIAVGQTDGLVVTGNTMIQHGALNDDPRTVTIPLLHVEQDAINVTLTDNILNGAPVVANVAWDEVIGASPAWTVSDNTVVKLDWDIGDSTGDPWGDVQGNGQADEFRFKGTWVTNSSRTDIVDDLLFAEGDTIVLINYQSNSFKGVWQGNQLDVNAAGTYVKIDSLTDLQELAHVSPAVTTSVLGDTLTLHIAQTGGTHNIVIDGVGEAFVSTYDPALF
ncbi:MAG: hypothetical protein DI556_06835 [Rhodovulum sulfidophilum]|uniref:Periplasmic copper-binding protein NosD beta helix domain-containing protein n=1 Tax=Rhodovulum sulfidophilum TaxID=35806 RepID=A0A2W5NJ27_RHOSU|nr:MAG: hypothetical protein DI556_06835 [Rhodovulum sulfidophilum]